jgi:small-conductance mechanosensitive channel
VKCWVFGASWGDQLTDVISSLIDYVINYVNRKAFLAMFLEVYNRAILKSNIFSSFKATSLVLLDLEVVLLKLKVKPCTLTLLVLGPTA